MEEDIKILEELCNEIIKKDDCNLFETLSPLEIALKLENLLKRYKELKEENRQLSIIISDMFIGEEEEEQYEI